MGSEAVIREIEKVVGKPIKIMHIDLEAYKGKGSLLVHGIGHTDFFIDVYGEDKRCYILEIDNANSESIELSSCIPFKGIVVFREIPT